MEKLIDVSIEPNIYYEVKSIVRAWEPGLKTGYIATYKGDNHVVSMTECVIKIQDFWSTITRYIKTEDADRLVMELKDVEVLNSRVAYLASDGSWRLHTISYP